MSNAKPLIGYTTRNSFWDPLQWLTDLAIRIAGGRPVRLYPKRPGYGTPIDGLIIGGGIDLYPAHYNLDPKPGYIYDHDRDDLEIAWLEHAEKAALPVLGICRGAQLLNVYKGGSLHIDIEKIYENAKYPAGWLASIIFRKPVTINTGTRLEHILNTQRLRINSLHKQSIDALGQGLIISAQEDNGIVQAIEDPAKDFCLGVQFHPEALIYKRRFRTLFKALIQSAAKTRI